MKEFTGLVVEYEKAGWQELCNVTFSLLFKLQKELGRDELIYHELKEIFNVNDAIENLENVPLGQIKSQMLLSSLTVLDNKVTSNDKFELFYFYGIVLNHT